MQQRSKTRRSWCWGWISPSPQGSSKSERSTRRPRRRVVQPPKKARNASGGDKEPDFLGEPFNADEARTKWPQRYQQGPAKRPDEEDDVMARCQYRSAKVDDVVYTLGDDDYVMVLGCGRALGAPTTHRTNADMGEPIGAPKGQNPAKPDVRLGSRGGVGLSVFSLNFKYTEEVCFPP